MAQGVGSRVATQGIPGGSGQVDRRFFYFHVCAACCSSKATRAAPAPGRRRMTCRLQAARAPVTNSLRPPLLGDKSLLADWVGETRVCGCFGSCCMHRLAKLGREWNLSRSLSRSWNPNPLLLLLAALARSCHMLRLANPLKPALVAWLVCCQQEPYGMTTYG